MKKRSRCLFLVALIFFILLVNKVYSVETTGVIEKKKIVVIIVNSPSSLGSQISLTKQNVMDMIVNREDSLSNFWNKNSYGQFKIVGADGNVFNEDDIFGPYSVNIPREASDIETMQMIYDTTKNGIPFSNGLTVLVFSNFGGWSARYNFGNEENPLILNFAIGVGQNDMYPLKHESSHLFITGEHAMYRGCFPNPTQLAEECTEFFHAYGDPYDILGGNYRYAGMKSGQSNAFMLEKAGILKDDINALHRIIAVSRDNLPIDGTYILKSISGDEPGLKALKIPHGYYISNLFGVSNLEDFKKTYFYIEWHQPIGLDAEMSVSLGQHETDIFDGVLLHLIEPGTTLTGAPSLIHGMALEGNFDSCTARNCPRVFRTTLLYGKSYTDPATGTKITVGFPTEQGLPISVELGRTDFEPPVINSLRVVERPDPFTAVIEPDVNDASGISKVEYYQWTGITMLGEKIAEVTSFPWRLTYTSHVGSKKIKARVYDNTQSSGGIFSNNFADSNFIDVDIMPEGRIKIESPYFVTPLDTDGLFADAEDDGGTYVYNLFGDPIKVVNPVPLNIHFSSGRPLAYMSLEELNPNELLRGRRIRMRTLKEIEFWRDANEHFAEVVEISEELPIGVHYFSLTVINLDGISFILLFALEVKPPPVFIRGDANNDGKVDLSDAIFILKYLFQGGQEPKCKDSADLNDDGNIDVSDSVYALIFLFKGGREPIAPYPLPGNDLSSDSLNCDIECGDGVKDSTETCDDGNENNEDTCNDECKLTTCGDGTIQSPNGQGVNEVCDGEEDAHKVCNEDCSIISRYICPEGLTAYWKFDSNSYSDYSRIYDTARNNNGILIINEDSDKRVDGVMGSAINFDGVDDYIEIIPDRSILESDGSSSLEPGTGSFSLSFWVKFRNVNSAQDQFIINFIRTGGGYYQVFLLSPANNFNLLFFTMSVVGSGVVRLQGGSNVLSEGRWYQYTIVRDINAKKVYLYIDGMKVREASDSTSGLFFLPRDKLYIGSADSRLVSPLNGAIDEIAIFKRALSEEEVRSIYNNGQGKEICNLQKVE